MKSSKTSYFVAIIRFYIELCIASIKKKKKLKSKMVLIQKFFSSYSVFIFQILKYPESFLTELVERDFFLSVS